MNSSWLQAVYAMNEPTTSPMRNPKKAPYIVSSSSSFFYKFGMFGYLLVEFRILPMWCGNCISGLASDTLETEKNLFVLTITSCLIILFSVLLGKYRFFSSKIMASIALLTSLVIISSEFIESQRDYWRFEKEASERISNFYWETAFVLDVLMR